MWVGIKELPNLAVEQGPEPGIPGRKQDVVFSIRAWLAVALITRRELPEVMIKPAHRVLDDVVEHLEAGIDGHSTLCQMRGIGIASEICKRATVSVMPPC